MVGSCLSSQASTSILIDKESFCLRIPIRNKLSFGVLIPLFLTSFVIFSFPDSPNQFASICEQHNSAIACSVW